MRDIQAKTDSDLSQLCRVAKVASNQADTNLHPCQERCQARAIYERIRPMGFDNP